MSNRYDSWDEDSRRDPYRTRQGGRSASRSSSPSSYSSGSSYASGSQRRSTYSSTRRTNLGHVDMMSRGDDYASSDRTSAANSSRRSSAMRGEVDYYDNARRPASRGTQTRSNSARSGAGRAESGRSNVSRGDTRQLDTGRYDASRYGSGRSTSREYDSYSTSRSGQTRVASSSRSASSGRSASGGYSSSGRRRVVSYEEDYDYNERDARVASARGGRSSLRRADDRSSYARSSRASSGRTVQLERDSRQRSLGRTRDDFERGGMAGGFEPQRKRRFGKLKVAIAAVLVLVLVGVGAAFAYTSMINSNLHKGLDTEDLSRYLVETDLTNEPFYMLLMGTDSSSEREADSDFGGSFRTDSIILARIDPVEKKVSMVSIHRDSMVDMGEYGQQKINSAHMYGGPSLSVQVISQMAGVDISHYAEINFDGFKSIVDALGGVEVDVPVEINDEDAGGHLDAGLQTLNGDQALILCRSRYTYINSADPDSMRAANQRLVLSAIMRKILDSDVATIANTVTALSQYVTTDLEVSDIIGLAQAMRGIDTSTDIYTDMEPVDNVLIDGIWYTYTNQEAWKEMMARMDAGLPPATVADIDEATGTVLATNGEDLSSSKKYAYVSIWNGSQNDNAGDQALKLLEDNGFVHASLGEAPEAYSETWVIYDDDSQAYEANTIVQALGQGRAVKNDGSWNFPGQFLVVIGDDWKAPASSSSGSSRS